MNARPLWCLVVAAGLAACSSSGGGGAGGAGGGGGGAGGAAGSPPPCAEVYDCPRGQTCWTLDGVAYSCMPSGAGLRGDTCDATVNTAATCGDQLACLSMGTPTAGTCVAWCDTSHPCPASTTCQAVTTTKGATLHLCL
jgi:hypothetical protein